MNYQYTKNPYFDTKEGTLEDAIKKAVTPAKKVAETASPKEVESKVEVKKEEIKEQAKNPYAIGMATAMKQTGDKPPLEKSTITKAHDIAKSIEKDTKEAYKKIDEVIRDMFNTSAAIQKANNSEMYKKTESHTVESSYADKFKAELEKSGKSIKDMSDDEKKAFFNKIDSKHQAKNEENDTEISDKEDHKEKVKNDPKAGEKEVIKPVKETSHEDEKKKEVEELTAAQKKLPPALQKAIKDKEDKKEEVKESISLVDQIKDMMREAYGKKQEEATEKEIDDFHTKLDKLVHKSFGHSSDEKKEEKDVPAGHHKMPDGTIMKDSEHKKEEVKEADEKKDDKEKAETADKIDALKKENQKLRNQITLAKVDKQRVARVEPNPKTGEVPLKIGVAQKLLKQKEESEKEAMKNKKVADTGRPASEIDTQPQYRPI